VTGFTVWLDANNAEYHEDATSVEFNRSGGLVLTHEDDEFDDTLVKAFAHGTWLYVEPGQGKVFSS
jgi:hypothetical protein